MSDQQAQAADSDSRPQPQPRASDAKTNAKSERAIDRLRLLLQEPGAVEALQQRMGTPSTGASRGRKPINLPELRDENGVRLTRYAIEKQVGLRRENGASKLKRLTNRHYRIIGAHLDGLSLEQICATFKVSINTVSRVLNDPLATDTLQKVYKHREAEINSLAGKAVAATRDALNDLSIITRLRGVDRFVKIRETMLDKEQGRESAEDVVARILQNARINGDVNIQVNQGK